jgi:hypothetical protein
VLPVEFGEHDADPVQASGVVGGLVLVAEALGEGGELAQQEPRWRSIASIESVIWLPARVTLASALASSRAIHTARLTFSRPSSSSSRVATSPMARRSLGIWS